MASNNLYELKEGNTENVSERLSKWAKLELGYEIAPSVLTPIFHSPEMIQIWNHIIERTKTVNPIGIILPQTTFSYSNAPELVSELNHLQETEDSLDLEIRELERNVELKVRRLTDNSEKLKAAEYDVKTLAAKIPILRSYGTWLDNETKTMNNFQSKLDNAASELPKIILETENKVKLAKDVQESLDLLREYYDLSAKGSMFSGYDKNVHRKVKYMVKNYTSQQVVSELMNQASVQDIDVAEVAANIKSVKDRIEKCFSKFHVAHRNSCLEVLEIENRNQELLKEMQFLIKMLKEQMEAQDNCSQLKELLDLDLNIVHTRTMLHACSNLKMPKSMSSVCSNLQAVQQQITEKETESYMLHQEIIAVNNANITTLEMLKNTVLVPNSNTEQVELGNSEIEKSFENKIKSVEQNLSRIGELLAEVTIGDNDLGNLCIRPNNTGMMADPTKKEILSAIDMPLEEAPEFLSVRLREKIKEHLNNRKRLDLQVQLINLMDEQSSSTSLQDIVDPVSIAYKKMPGLIAQANTCIEHLGIESTTAELKESLDDFRNLPALDKNIL